MKTKEMVLAALLTAIAIIIPILFTPLRIVLPPYPFTATISSHVPILLAMFISPVVAAIVAIGSAIGFFFAGTPMPVVARAASHVLFAFIGAIMLKKGYNFWFTWAISAAVHGVAEALVVIPFGFPLSTVSLIIVFGTIAHHSVDIAIAFPIYKILKSSKIADLVDINYTRLKM